MVYSADKVRTATTLKVDEEAESEPGVSQRGLDGGKCGSLPGYFCTVIRIYVNLCASVHQGTLLPCKLHYSLFHLELVNAGYEGTRCAVLSPLDSQPDREKEVKLLQQEVEAVNGSADKAVEDSEKMFTELIRLMEKRSSDRRAEIQVEVRGKEAAGMETETEREEEELLARQKGRKRTQEAKRNQQKDVSGRRGQQIRNRHKKRSNKRRETAGGEEMKKCGYFESAQSTSSWGSEVFLDRNAVSGMLATSPSLRRLKRIICVKHTFASSVQDFVEVKKRKKRRLENDLYPCDLCYKVFKEVSSLLRHSNMNTQFLESKNQLEGHNSSAFKVPIKDLQDQTSQAPTTSV
ncbi:hypothetical protein F7725_011090 [Dissostichus mawsoni]|uniref:C2H2-type domain-containing protein n=1 Tax=Dissostichus mawsoni TaxID=36200 RepID=A0A7J5ZA14_DISMA|nr:hypothetical protein F7725_011090 [Dissostichus mawsoni]